MIEPDQFDEKLAERWLRSNGLMSVGLTILPAQIPTTKISGEVPAYTSPLGR